MTTAVTVKTHELPVRATIHDSHLFQGPKNRASSKSISEQFLDANSECEFIIDATRSISFAELPKEATDLDHADRLATGDA